jgi:hypothetical protein
MMLCCCGLRGWGGAISGRNVLRNFVSLANSSAYDPLISRLSRLVNNAHNELAADRRRKTCKNAGPERNKVIKIEHLVDKRRGMIEL